MIFSTISLLIVVSFAVWWSTRDTDVLLQQTTKSEQSTPDAENNDVEGTPIQQAQKAKTLLESNTSNTLDLSGQNLTKAPEYIFARTNTESLDLSNNKLTGSLQAEIRKLENLTSLDLSDNEFTGVPAEVGQLTNLRILDLSNNQLTGLPYELGNLSNLSELDISGNQYSKADLEVILKKFPPSVHIKK